MTLNLNTIGLLTRDESSEYPFDEVRDLFGKYQIEVVLIEEGITPDHVDMVVAMGGDGTVLRALDRFPRCPVLAINFGTVGFLTAGDRTDLASIVKLLMDGRYIVSERLVLNCRYPGGEMHVVNEVMVRASYKLAFTDVFVDGAEIRTITGDGVIVGTPTGSTGHLLSSGAPIVVPDVRCMILDGINEYNFSSRALILPPEAHIRLYISEETRDENVSLVVDGRHLGQLLPGQEVHISQAQHRARLIYLDKRYFFRNLSSKLSW
ncbi:MAG: NAD(+)/NADH kinase [Candidatus Latescibacterota bacterium]|nr:NAD(+)/NADH kinase [Candidatus Latescibacterota bacterium]MEE2627415.1 NAD(+)/NADH kinase [Candidatus Latescibacterota bacterium]MEE2726801.1 NAD(+)/NADH kinase [Candidatus Latescibacterota bacterium]